VAYFNPKIEIKSIVNAALDEALPAWEANYEPGNVSDYLIGYANDEAAAKGAAIAWLTSQSDKDPATLEWVEMPTGDQHDHWYDLIQNHDDGIPTDTGINVRHRLPAGIRDAARQASGQQPDSAETVVAYRSVYAPSLLFCREHKQDWPGFTPLTSDDLPDGGICTWGPNDGPKCGRDVLIDVQQPAPAAGLSDTQPANDRAAVLREAADWLHSIGEREAAHHPRT
jgi:hypothetical protein